MKKIVLLLAILTIDISAGFRSKDVSMVSDRIEPLDTVKRLFSTVENNFNTVKNSFGVIENNIKSSLNNAFNDVKTSLLGSINDVKSFSSGVISDIKGSDFYKFTIGEAKCWRDVGSEVVARLKVISNSCPVVFKPFVTMRKLINLFSLPSEVFDIPCNLIDVIKTNVAKCFPVREIHNLLLPLMEKLKITQIISSVENRWASSNIDQIIEQASQKPSTSFLEVDDKYHSVATQCLKLWNLDAKEYSSGAELAFDTINFLNNQVARLGVSKQVIISLDALIKLVKSLKESGDSVYLASAHILTPMTPGTPTPFTLHTYNPYFNWMDAVSNAVIFASGWLDYAILDSNGCVLSIQTLMMRKTIEPSFDLNKNLISAMSSMGASGFSII